MLQAEGHFFLSINFYVDGQTGAFWKKPSTSISDFPDPVLLLLI